jgi:hypothetical protein
MDKYRIMEWVINAVLVIVTTAVVTRLSLNKGKLSVTQTLKARFTPRFKAYTKLSLSAVIFIVLTINLYSLVSNPALPTRYDVLSIVFNFTGVMGWLSLGLFFLKRLLAFEAWEKTRLEQERWQPLLNDIKQETASLRETLDQAKEGAKEPRDSKSESPNPKA